MKKAEVIKDQGNPVVIQVLEEAIVNISRSIKKVLNGNISRRAIVLLIQDNTSPKVSQNEIRAVLDSIESLETTYITKKTV